MNPSMMNPSLAVALLTATFESQITGIDWFVIAFYFSILLGVAWYVVKRSMDSAADYFLAGRNLVWWEIGASMFAANMGADNCGGVAVTGRHTGADLGDLRFDA